MTFEITTVVVVLIIFGLFAYLAGKAEKAVAIKAALAQREAQAKLVAKGTAKAETKATAKADVKSGKKK